MTTLSYVERQVEHGGDAPDGFFDFMRSSNPFLDNRVTGLSADGVDVDDIHRGPFEQLTELARQARDLRRGLGVVVWGEAGVGKSHLLSRLLRWAENDWQAVAVYLHNLQASPENLPRSLLKAVVSILSRGWTHRFRGTPLFRLVLSLLYEALNRDNTFHPWPVAHAAYSRLIDGLGQEPSLHAAPVDRAIYGVFWRFFVSAYRASKTHDETEAALAVRWLAGDCIDAAEGRRLGLPPGRIPDEPIALQDNQQVKQVLVALSRAALGARRPFLLCFDQVDNLDQEQAAALARFLEALIDSAPNMLIVIAGVQATLLRWREMGVFQDSAWDRLKQFELPLQRMSPAEGRRIVAARLEKAVAPFDEADPVRRQMHEDDLFPLSRRWAEAFFRNKIAVRPRDVINGAREAWHREQESLRRLGGAAWLEQWGRAAAGGDGPAVEWTAEQIREAIDRKTDQKIAEHCEQRLSHPETLPPDAANLAGLIAALLGDAGGFEIERAPADKPSAAFPFTLVARRRAGGPGAAARTGLLVLVEAAARPTTYALRYALEAGGPEAGGPADRVLLVTDERRPLVYGKQPSPKGKQYYEDLLARGPGRFRHMNLTLEQYARLDALHAVAGMARSGDLEIELPGGQTRPVGVQEVIESHHRRGRFLSAPVLGNIIAHEPSADAVTM